MNKKILLFGIVGISLLAIISAITYYSLFSVTFEVLPSIIIGGNLQQELQDVYSGEIIEGQSVTIDNEAPSERVLTITSDSPEEIGTSYFSETTLSQKVVDFGNEPWALTGDTAIVKYTLIGDKFAAEVIEGQKLDYVLVYYKDNSDRFNSPAKAIIVDSVIGDLPYEDDTNNDEYNYCETGEYMTCHGAKLWYIPESAIDTEGNINWGMADDFLFETELIQYNSEGEIIIYPGETLTITSKYEPNDYASGEYTITTTIA